MAQHFSGAVPQSLGDGEPSAGPWLCPWTRVDSATSSTPRTTWHPQTAAAGCSGHLHAQEVWLRLNRAWTVATPLGHHSPPQFLPERSTKDHGPGFLSCVSCSGQLPAPLTGLDAAG